MSEYEIEVDVVVEEPVLAVAALQQAVVAVLQYEGVQPPAGVSLLLTDDAQLQQLNRDFRGYDKPTDVLSFPAGDEPIPGLPGYLGDIAISVPTAQRQAAAAGHALADELLLLTVHGVLHLLGHDHGDADEKGVMWQAQGAVLRQLGVDPDKFPLAEEDDQA